MQTKTNKDLRYIKQVLQYVYAEASFGEGVKVAIEEALDRIEKMERSSE